MKNPSPSPYCPSPLSGEIEIVWNFDPALFPFVRVAKLVSLRASSRAVNWHDRDGRFVVGYATGRPGCGFRRVFYVMPYDFDSMDWQPIESVDPLTVSPCQAGRKTPRCMRPLEGEEREAQRAIFAERSGELKRQRAQESKRQRRHRAKANRKRRVTR